MQRAAVFFAVAAGSPGAGEAMMLVFIGVGLTMVAFYAYALLTAEWEPGDEGGQERGRIVRAKPGKKQGPLAAVRSAHLQQDS